MDFLVITVLLCFLVVVNGEVCGEECVECEEAPTGQFAIYKRSLQIFSMPNIFHKMYHFKMSKWVYLRNQILKVKLRHRIQQKKEPVGDTYFNDVLDNFCQLLNMI